MVPLFGLIGGAAYCPLRVVKQFGMLQQVPPTWSLKEFAFDIPSGFILKEEKKDLQAKVHKIILSLDNLPLQVVQWPKSLEGDMEIYMASKEYI